MPFPKPHRVPTARLRIAILVCLGLPAALQAAWTPVPGIHPAPDLSWKPGINRQSPRMICDREGFLYVSPADTLFIIGPDGALRASPPSTDSMPAYPILGSSGGLLLWGKRTSLDRGLTWIEGDKFRSNPRTLAVFPDGRVLTGGLNEGMSLSLDSCRTWKSVHFGPSFASINQVAALDGWALSAPDRNSLLVSMDRGETWRDLPGVEARVLAGMIRVDPDPSASCAWVLGGKPPSVYALKRQGDSIAIFSRAPERGFPESTATALAVSLAPDSGRRLWLGTWGQGIFTSDDSGATWTPRNAGLRDLGVDAIAVTPAGKVWALTRDGLYADLDLAVGMRPARAKHERGTRIPARTAGPLYGEMSRGPFRADGRLVVPAGSERN